MSTATPTIADRPLTPAERELLTHVSMFSVFSIVRKSGSRWTWGFCGINWTAPTFRTRQGAIADAEAFLDVVRAAAGREAAAARLAEIASCACPECGSSVVVDPEPLSSGAVLVRCSRHVPGANLRAGCPWSTSTI